MHSNKVGVVIVEDELIIAEDLSDILDLHGYEVCGIAKRFEDAIQMISDQLPDIVLLDIMIKGDKDGIEVARTIRSEFSLPFIFLSSHSDEATIARAKEVRPYAYLVKPFEEDDVTVAMEMALNNFAHETSQKPTETTSDFILNNCLFIRQSNLAIKVPFSEISYIEANANYSTIFAADKKYVVRLTLKELEDRLPSHLFFRSHKSYIVSLENLSAINSDTVMVGDVKLPIGRRQQAWLIENINRI